MANYLGALLAIISVLPTYILAAPTKEHLETFALTRDNLGRTDPDELLFF